MASLKIDVAVVNAAVTDLNTQLGKLETMEGKLLSGLGSGWESENANIVNEKLEAFHLAVGKIRTSIASINAAVSQYKTNVSEVDSNTVSFKNE